MSVRGIGIHTYQYSRLFSGTQLYPRVVSIGRYAMGTDGCTKKKSVFYICEYDQLRG